ncbi:MAG: Ig-like domain-containing protein [Porphyromonas sp.]|nr:Ig-like domain-containing protein [Porphyromonas sp.]
MKRLNTTILISLPLVFVLLFVTSCLKPEPCNRDFIFKKEAITLNINEQEKLTFTVEQPQDLEITWRSEDPTIATVKDGLVHAQNAGKTVVSAEAKINGVTKIAKCTVTVNPTEHKFSDPNLPKRVLQLHPEIDANGDGIISPEEALQLKELNLEIADKAKATAEEKITSVEGIQIFKNLTFLNLKNQFIGDATPIESLKELQKLYITQTEIPSLRVDGMPQLQDLRLFGNKKLSAIDVTQNPKLNILYVQDTQISSINVSNNKELEDFNVNRTQVSRLELVDLPKLTQILAVNCKLDRVIIKGLPQLQKVFIDNNQLSSVSLSDLPELNRLSVYKNRLTSLSLENLPKLMFLFAHENQLETLDLSKLPMLFELNVDQNPLTQLDLSKNPVIRTLGAENMPKLQEINLRNGEYNDEAEYLVKEGNTALKRVLVDKGPEETHLLNIFPKGTSGVEVIAE